MSNAVVLALAGIDRAPRLAARERVRVVISGRRNKTGRRRLS
jgi:hypothetical protein